MKSKTVSVFARFLFRLSKRAYIEKKALLISIFVLDAVSAISKITLVLLFAAVATSFTNNEMPQAFGITLPLEYSISGIVILGIVVGLIAVTGAICAYFSVYQARKLGRWANYRAMYRVHSALAQRPQSAIMSRYRLPGNLNILLTQLPIHTGLAYETLARLVNPIVLLCVATLALFYQQPFFTIGSIIIGLIATPFLAKAALEIRANAKNFYSDHASGLGAGVNITTGLMNNQHGIIEKPTGVKEQLSFAREFFNSFDKNLLANDKTGLLISLVDAVLRPLLFIVLCSLVFLERFTIGEAIAFLGSLAYVLASSRTVGAYLTNILRFHPQVREYLRLVDDTDWEALRSDSSDNINTLTKIPFTTKSGDIGTFRAGEISMVMVKKSIATMHLGEILPPLFCGQINKPELRRNLFFANAKFRFAQGVSVMDQLLGEADSRMVGALSHCERILNELSIVSEIDQLPQGKQSEMNEYVWGRLGADARFAMRVVPLLLRREGSLLFVEASIFQAASVGTLEVVRRNLRNRYLFIVLTEGVSCKEMAVDKYIRVDDTAIEAAGNREWFYSMVAVEAEKSKSGGDEHGAIEMTSLL